ncbi:hypothetical protein [Fluviicola taffensis]|uniref:Uncharacterized protein n=1 Tax=Fluviicola taffensis (strain DSM 16823 / NCIMB 13979 / RW262) TaxID=755732 RepID=F2IAA1_FLUTR|nr:hypothetical protein [Fluviicola taffensis]AEA42036.1 hypothetical protein Fluta_0026 [Fluviicola taffensis DSM 16823]
MKKYLLSILIGLPVAACTNSNPDEKEATNKITDKTELSDLKPKTDSIGDTLERNPLVKELSATQIQKLKQLVNQKTIDDIILFNNNFATVQTDFDFARVYHTGRKLFDAIEKDVYRKFPDNGYNAMEAMKFIDKSFALRSSCEAECTEFVMNYHFLDLQKLAKFTKGNADDEFIKLKIAAEGESGRLDPQWLTFFERTWDYGGGSLLGDSAIFNFMESSFKSLQKSDLFKTDILAIRESVIETMKHRIYMFSKEAVLSEINRIIKSKILLPKEIIEITGLRKVIEKDQEDPALQFNCSDPEQNCDWGG